MSYGGYPAQHLILQEHMRQLGIESIVDSEGRKPVHIEGLIDHQAVKAVYPKLVDGQPNGFQPHIGSEKVLMSEGGKAPRTQHKVSSGVPLPR